MNLLPKHQKELIEKEMKFKLLFGFFSMFTFWLAIFAVLEYAMVLYVKVQIPATNEKIEREKSTEASKMTGSIEEEIKFFNNTLSRVSIIQSSGDTRLPQILIRIGEIMPEGARLEKLSFSVGNIALTGHADKRSDILELKGKLEKEYFCSKLTAPVVPLREEDVRFSFSCDKEPAEAPEGSR